MFSWRRIRDIRVLSLFFFSDQLGGSSETKWKMGGFPGHVEGQGRFIGFAPVSSKQLGDDGNLRVPPQEIWP